MRRAWPVCVFAVGGLVLLASLYLPWLEPSAKPGGPAGLNLFSLSFDIDGLSTDVGDAAALSALLVVGVAVAGMVRPRLTDRLPLGYCALLASYFAIAVGAEARST